MKYKVKLTVTKKYFDIERNENMKVGDIFETSKERATLLLNLGYVSILEIAKLSKKKNG